MGWFFGCFGGSSKKDRKHQAPVSPLPKQQKPSSTLPLRVPYASASAIPIKAFPGRDASNSEDLFTVRQVSSSAPVRATQGAYLHGGATIRLPEKEQKPGPWHQLDDLEEELNDLRKQIDKESLGAEQVREEVNYFKSCGSLVKSPSKFKSSQQVDHQQSSVQEGRWRSWLAPGDSSMARTPPEKIFQFEGLKAALCEPTPAKESHGLLLGVQTPIQSKNLTLSTMHQAMQGNVPANSFNAINKSDAGSNLITPAKFQHNHQALPGPSRCNARSINSKVHLGNLGTPLEKPCDNSNQSIRSSYGMEGTSCTNAAGDESILMKKRRLAANVNLFQCPHAIKQSAEGNVNHEQDQNPLGQKRLKVASSGGQVGGEMKSSLRQADPVPMHFFRCDSLSPILESGTSNEESASSDNEGIAQGPSVQLQNSYNSASQEISQSPSLRQSPASQGKSVTFASMNDEEYTTDEVSFSRDAKYSEESYTNSTCINDAGDEDLETASYSPSTDSEETLSDLSPERCYSPPISPSRERKSTVFKSFESSGSTFERPTAKSYSAQSSSANGGRKKQHVSRYGSDEDEGCEDENELFTDALSHVSTECSERQFRKWHAHTESMDSVSTQMGHGTDAIDTPPKLSDRVSTPNINIQGKHMSRIRSKPASSVLTPVENVSQWKQLKERDQKHNSSGKAGIDSSSKFDTSKKVEEIGGKATIGDENKNFLWTPSRKEGRQLVSQNDGLVSVNTSLSHRVATSGPEAVHVNVNASLSHWGITSRANMIGVSGSVSQWGTTTAEPVRVDMSLSHWLKSSVKHNETQTSISTSSNSSSSGGGGVVSPAPRPDHQLSHIAKQTERSQPFVYAATERPILGALGEEIRGNVKPRSPWDGKGTPNSTAKYMEDQRVKWHSTPFEQRLEKALDKQGILLQKKLFTATPAAY